MTAFIDTLVFVCASLSNMLITGIMVACDIGAPNIKENQFDCTTAPTENKRKEFWY